jgi:hypothetical protein
MVVGVVQMLFLTQKVNIPSQITRSRIIGNAMDEYYNNMDKTSLKKRSYLVKRSPQGRLTAALNSIQNSHSPSAIDFGMNDEWNDAQETSSNRQFEQSQEEFQPSFQQSEFFEDPSPLDMPQNFPNSQLPQNNFQQTNPFQQQPNLQAQQQQQNLGPKTTSFNAASATTDSSSIPSNLKIFLALHGSYIVFHFIFILIVFYDLRQENVLSHPAFNNQSAPYTNPYLETSKPHVQLVRQELPKNDDTPPPQKGFLDTAKQWMPDVSAWYGAKPQANPTPDTKLSHVSMAGSEYSTPNNMENAKTVIIGYNPVLEDELCLVIGDRIQVEEEFDDGWGIGQNLDTGAKGAFPLKCIQ